MVSKDEGFIPIEPEEIAKYIFSKLLEVGIIVKQEDIELILELELEYLQELGIGMLVFEDIDED